MLTNVALVLIAALALIVAPVTCWLLDDWFTRRRVERGGECERREALRRIQGGGGSGWYK